jgi:Leucine-rich repeat (LRR) protein
MISNENMKQDDFGIIRDIEDRLGEKLEQVRLDEINRISGYKRGFALSGNKQVTALRLDAFFYLKSVQDKIGRLKGLRKIILRECYLYDASFLKELKQLTHIDLSENKLKDVSFIKELDQLTEVDLSMNPIKNPPPEVVEQGLDAIRDYLRSNDTGAEKN